VLKKKRQYMAEGIIGDSGRASAAAGKQINSYVIEELVKLIKAVM